MIDCQVTDCYLYDKECFFKTVLVRKPDPKTGCSYCRRIQNGKDKNENKIRKTGSDKVIQRDKKRKKKENLLKEIL